MSRLLCVYIWLRADDCACMYTRVCIIMCNPHCHTHRNTYTSVYHKVPIDVYARIHAYMLHACYVWNINDTKKMATAPTAKEIPRAGRVVCAAGLSHWLAWTSGSSYCTQPALMYSPHIKFACILSKLQSCYTHRRTWMYICTHVYMCIWIYICIYMYTHVYICVYVCVCVCVYVCVCMYVWYARTYAYTHSSTHKNIDIDTYKHRYLSDVDVHIYVHIYKHILLRLTCTMRGGGLGSSTIFKKCNEPYAPS